MKLFKKVKKGFTLVELVVVIAVIAVLAAVSVGAYFGITESANHSKSEQEAKQAYTQLQTKTLAGLDLGNSGTSVTLGKDGLTFNGFYDNNILNHLNNLVFKGDMNVDVIPGEGSISESAELNDKASVYFFANKDSNNNILATHMGYVPASTSAKYAKYVDLSSGKISSTLEGTYSTSILPEGIAKETIKYSSFNYQPSKDVYSELGSYTGTYGTYKGSAYARVVTEDKPYDLLQIRKSDNSGILMSDSKNQIKYIAVNWAESEHTNESDAINVYGSFKYSYENFDAPSTDPAAVITYPNVLTSIEDEFYFARITSLVGTTVIESLDIYFDTNAAKPNIPSNINFSYNGSAVTSIITKDVTNPITIDTDTPVTFTKVETIAGSVVVTADGNTVTNTNNAAGRVLATATSTIDTSLSKTIEIEYRPLESYTYGLVNDIADLTDGSKIVLVANSRNSYMGVLEKNHHKNITAAVDSDGATSYTGNNLEFNFTNYSEAEILTVKTVEVDGNTYYAFAVETTEGTKYLYESGNNNLNNGELYDSNDQLKHTALFTIDEIDAETGEVYIKVKDEPERAIKLNKSNDANRFGTYSSTQSNYEVVAIYKENANTNFNVARIESFANQYLKVGDKTEITTNFYPTFATSSKDLTYTVSGDPAITVSPEGDVTAVATGTSNVEVKCGEATFTLTFYVDEAVNSLVKSTGELEIGAKYAIVAKDYDVAMGSSRGNNRNEAEVTKNEELLSLINNEVEIITLEAGTDEGSFKLRDLNNKYLSAQEKESNYFLSLEELNEYGEWSFSFGEGSAVTIQSTASDCTRNKILYNSSSKLFSCYGGISEQVKEICLYRIETVVAGSPSYISLEASSDQINVGETVDINVNLYDYFNTEITNATFDVTSNLSTDNYSISSLENVYTFTPTVKGEYVLTFTLNSTNYNLSKSIAIEVLGADEVIPEKYSYTFTSKQFKANGTMALGEVDWTCAGDGGYWGYEGTRGQQFGSGGAPYKELILTATLSEAKSIKSIKISTSGGSKIKATLNVVVNSSDMGAAISLSTTNTEYLFANNESVEGNTIKLQYQQTSSVAIYIKMIEIEYYK